MDQDRVSAFLEATTLVGNAQEHDEADRGVSFICITFKMLMKLTLSLYYYLESDDYYHAQCQRYLSISHPMIQVKHTDSYCIGLEWPCVFVMGCEGGIIPHPRADIMEEW